MTWTKDPPTVPGWYWYYGDYDASNTGSPPLIVCVEEDSIYGLVGWQPFMDYKDPLNRFHGVWMGPLEPPTAPKEDE